MTLTGGKRKVNKGLKSWVAFVKRVQKEEKLSYKDAIHRAKVRKDKGEKWMMKGGDDDDVDVDTDSGNMDVDTDTDVDTDAGNMDIDTDVDVDMKGGRRKTRRHRKSKKSKKTKRRRSRRH